MDVLGCEGEGIEAVQEVGLPVTLIWRPLVGASNPPGGLTRGQDTGGQQALRKATGLT